MRGKQEKKYCEPTATPTPPARSPQPQPQPRGTTITIITNNTTNAAATTNTTITTTTVPVVPSGCSAARPVWFQQAINWRTSDGLCRKEALVFKREGFEHTQ